MNIELVGGPSCGERICVPDDQLEFSVITAGGGSEELGKPKHLMEPPPFRVHVYSLTPIERSYGFVVFDYMGIR